jgi:hypothetical protein
VFRSVTLPDVYDISDEECYCSSDTNVTKVWKCIPMDNTYF